MRTLQVAITRRIAGIIVVVLEKEELMGIIII
jgi:hypothetical protein